MKSSPPTPLHHPCLLRGFSTESTSRKTPPGEENTAAPLPIQRQNSQQKRPTKLLRSPPPSGRPSVTFSLVLEEEIGAAARKEEAEMKEAEDEAENRQQIHAHQQENWSMNCCSPTSPPAEGEPRIKLLLFCASIPLMECARFVGWLATIPIVVSFFLLPFAPSSLVELVPELFLLGTQSICVLALFFGLQHQLPNYLRPFLYFGLFWNLVLLLLLLFSLIELLVSRERFCAQIWLTVYELIYGEMPPTEPPRIRLDQLDPFSNLVVQLYREDQALRRKGAGATAQLPPDSSGFALGLSLCLVSLLALTILVDGWLLNIVLLAYLHMKRNGKGRARGDWYGGGLLEGGGNGAGGNAEQEQELRQALLASANRKDRQQPSTASRTSSCATSSSLNDDDEDEEDNLGNGLVASSSATCLMTNGTKTMGLENGGFQKSAVVEMPTSSQGNAFENANGNGSRLKWAECIEKVENVTKIEQRRKSEGIEGNFGINGGKESARKFSENGHHHKMGCPHKKSKEKTSNSLYSP